MIKFLTVDPVNTCQASKAALAAEVSKSDTDDMECLPDNFKQPFDAETNTNESNRHSTDNEARTSEPAVCHLLGESRVEHAIRLAGLERMHVRQHESAETSGVYDLRSFLQVPPTVYYIGAQLENGTHNSSRRYILDDMSKIVEEGEVNLEMSKPPLAIKGSLSQTKSSSGETYPVTNRWAQTAHSLRKPFHPVAQSDKPNVASANPNAARMKTMKSNLTRSTRPNATMAPSAQSSRQPVRPSQTFSATATRCTRPRPTSPAPVTRPSRPANTNNHLPRKPTGDEPTTNKTPTYAIKNPLPHKANVTKPRLQTPRAPFQRTSLNLRNESSRVSSSHKSLSMRGSEWKRYSDPDDDIDVQPTSYPVRPDQIISGDVKKLGSKANLTTFPRTLTPRPSLRQVNEARIGRSFVDPRQNPGQMSRACSSNRVRTEDTQADKLTQPADTTIRDRSSSTDSKFADADNQPHDQQPDVGRSSDTTDYTPGLVQSAMKREPAVSSSVIRYRHQQKPDAVPSQSHRSVASGELPPCRKKSDTSRQVPPSISMSTIATEGGRFATRPLRVPPSGPAHHRRSSKIPRPKPSVHYSMSVTSAVSRCLSVESLRSEFNYARPMPIERIPFSKFGLEYVMPLARQQDSALVEQAFSITGLSGQRQRHLPLVDSIAEDLWDEVTVGIDRLPVAKARFDAGLNECCVTIVASIVDRPVRNVATQTRQKSVSLSPPSPSPPQRKKKTTQSKEREKTRRPQDDNSNDYSSMLVKLVQLLYVQAKLRAEKNNPELKKAEKQKVEKQTRLAESDPPAPQTLMEYLQQRQRNYTANNAAQPQNPPRQYNPIYNHPQYSAQGARFYHGSGAGSYQGPGSGSSVTQIYSKNYSNSPAGRVQPVPGNGWTNSVNSRTVYFGSNQWPSYQNQANSIPTYAAPSNLYNRFRYSSIPAANTNSFLTPHRYY